MIKYTLFYLSVMLLFISCNEKSAEAKLKEYVRKMEVMPDDNTLIALPFETKYKIIERGLKDHGLSSKYSYEEIAEQLKKSFVSDELFNEENSMGDLAFYIAVLWGSKLNLQSSLTSEMNYVDLSDDFWLYNAQDEDTNYEKYAQRLNGLRDNTNDFTNWNERFDESKNAFVIQFTYKGAEYNWEIENIINGSINNDFFYKYTELIKDDYPKKSDYYIMMQGEGGLIMFLDESQEAYLRKLWNFPKINALGSIPTLNSYGQL